MPYSAAIFCGPVTNFARARRHCLAGARHRVGQVVVGDRVAERHADVERPFGADGTPHCGIGALMHGRLAGIGEVRRVGDDGFAQRFDIVVRKPLAQNVGERAQDRPILLRVARRGGGAPGHLYAAFEIGVETVLLRIGGARQDDVGIVRPGVAVASLIDDEGAAEMADVETRRRRADRRSRSRPSARRRRCPRRRGPSRSPDRAPRRATRRCAAR